MSAHGSSLGGKGNALFPVLFLVHFSVLFEDFYFVPVLLLLSSVVIGISSLFLLFLSFSLSLFFLSVVVVLLRLLSF